MINGLITFPPLSNENCSRKNVFPRNYKQFSNLFCLILLEYYKIMLWLDGRRKDQLTNFGLEEKTKVTFLILTYADFSGSGIHSLHNALILFFRVRPT
jgi:hypothetical protein